MFNSNSYLLRLHNFDTQNQVTLYDKLGIYEYPWWMEGDWDDSECQPGLVGVD